MAERRFALPPLSGECEIDRPDNAFLNILAPKLFEQLSGQLTEIDLELGAYLHHNDDKIDWVYFPETSLMSLVAASPIGERVETTMVGNEGASGLMEVCGSQVSSVDCVVQVDGKAWRAPAAFCRTLAQTDQEFSAAAWRLAELQLVESRQSTLCQAMHPVEQRFARWMCESVERCGGRNPLPMTQEFLAAMLGVQRTTVSSFASALQRKGMINYRRGRVEIVDRDGLEALACNCRKVMVGQRTRLGFPSVGATRPTGLASA